jgi:hypothetical protein
LTSIEAEEEAVDSLVTGGCCGGISLGPIIEEASEDVPFTACALSPVLSLALAALPGAVASLSSGRATAKSMADGFLARLPNITTGSSSSSLFVADNNDNDDEVDVPTIPCSRTRTAAALTRAVAAATRWLASCTAAACATAWVVLGHSAACKRCVVSAAASAAASTAAADAAGVSKLLLAALSWLTFALFVAVIELKGPVCGDPTTTAVLLTQSV